GEIAVLDWGLARRRDEPPEPDVAATKAIPLPPSKPTLTGTVLGTPGYMAPEQALGATARIGPWSDVFALGAMLYEVIAGTPFAEAPGLGGPPEMRDAELVRSLKSQGADDEL